MVREIREQTGGLLAAKWEIISILAAIALGFGATLWQNSSSNNEVMTTLRAQNSVLASKVVALEQKVDRIEDAIYDPQTGLSVSVSSIREQVRSLRHRGLPEQD